MKTAIALAGASALVLGLAIAPADLARAQQADEMEEVVVTGSRIRRNPLDEPVAIMEIRMAATTRRVGGQDRIVVISIPPR